MPVGENKIRMERKYWSTEGQGDCENCIITRQLESDRAVFFNSFDLVYGGNYALMLYMNGEHTFHGLMDDCAITACFDRNRHI